MSFLFYWERREMEWEYLQMGERGLREGGIKERPHVHAEISSSD